MFKQRDNREICCLFRFFEKTIQEFYMTMQAYAAVSKKYVTSAIMFLSDLFCCFYQIFKACNGFRYASCFQSAVGIDP